MKIELAPYMKVKKAINVRPDFKTQEYCLFIKDKKSICDDIERAKANIEKLVDVKHTVVVGMGGSSLGVKAFSYLSGFKNISFLDELSDYKAEKVLSSLDLKRTVFLVISKSGNTSETLVLFDYIQNFLSDRGISIRAHVHVITVPNNSNMLLKKAKSLEVNFFEFPPNLSGRFSMFGFPGLLPMALAGVNISDIHLGLMKAMNANSLVNELAEVIVESIVNRDFGHNFWTYDGRLTYFRAWLRQLISESLGKSSTDHPEYSLPPFIECKGSTDQHSYLQHVLALPKRSLNFIFEVRVDMKQGALDQKQAMEAYKLKDYFSKYKIRFVEVILTNQDVQNVSQFFAIWMFVTHLVGESYGLDVFKQENIDELKRMALS